MKPFSEHNQFEQSSTDSFFVSGSKSSLGDGGFDRSLSNKTQVKLTLPIVNPVKMLANKSSIYYYNVNSKQWNIPQNIIKNGTPILGPFQANAFSFPTHWSPPWGNSPAGYTNGSLFNEDAKGFNAYGRPIALKDVNPVDQSITTTNCYRHVNDNLNGLFDSSTDRTLPVQKVKNKFVDLLSFDYAESFQRYFTTQPTVDETLSVPIDQPFLIEKLVIDIPFCFGTSWFQDRTATVYGHFRDCEYGTSPPYTPLPNLIDQSFYDKGGPALTVALFCKKNYGVRYDGTSDKYVANYILDLIATGTITHYEDSKRSINIAVTPASKRPYDAWQSYDMIDMSETGLIGASSVVSRRNSDGMFTGSVAVKMTAAVSNGIEFAFSRTTDWSGFTNAKIKSFLSDLFESPDQPNETSSYDLIEVVPTDVDAFGRGMTGFAPSGGSIFGGEYASSEKVTYSNIDNFYIEDEDERDSLTTKSDTLIDSLFTGSNKVIRRTACVSISRSKESPYLLNPGDSLVLSISKTRPVISGSSFRITSKSNADVGLGVLTNFYPLTGSSSGHDIQLNTGSITMTLYGSQIRNNRGYTP